MTGKGNPSAVAVAPGIPLPQTVKPAFRLTLEARARAAEARKDRVAARKSSSLRRDFLDALRWEDMARARGLRLPPWGEPATPAGMEKWLRKLGMPVSAYLSWTGEATLRDFAGNNPDWPLRAWAGLVLERCHNGKKSRKISCTS